MYGVAWTGAPGGGGAKAALETTTRYLAVELAPRGINVNCVVPGFVATASAKDGGRWFASPARYCDEAPAPIAYFCWLC